MTSTAIKVLIVDDHPVFRRGLKEILATERRLRVVGDVNNGSEAVSLTERVKPDVVLMDLVMPGLDGIEATKRILAGHPQTRILILTSFGSDGKLFPALEAGALGFLLKDAQPDDLVRAIFQVARGETSLCTMVTRRLLHELHHEPRQDAPSDSLSERETEVLGEIAHGLSNAEIADALCISPATVRTHVSSILGKLNLTRRTQAVLYALKQGIVRIEEEEPTS